MSERMRNVNRSLPEIGLQLCWSFLFRPTKRIILYVPLPPLRLRTAGFLLSVHGKCWCSAAAYDDLSPGRLSDRADLDLRWTGWSRWIWGKSSCSWYRHPTLATSSSAAAAAAAVASSCLSGDKLIKRGALSSDLRNQRIVALSSWQQQQQNLPWKYHPQENKGVKNQEARPGRLNKHEVNWLDRDQRCVTEKLQGYLILTTFENKSGAYNCRV